MLQSITVLLLVLTIKKGSCIVEFEAGGPSFCCSFCWFLCTKFLNAICCRKKDSKRYLWQSKSQHQCFQEVELHIPYLQFWLSPVIFCQKVVLAWLPLFTRNRSLTKNFHAYPSGYGPPSKSLAKKQERSNKAWWRMAPPFLLKKHWSQRSSVILYA